MYTKEQLKAMTEAYIERALWADCRDENGEPIGDRTSIYEFTNKDQRAAYQRCKDFAETAGELLTEWTPEQAGHDLWLTHNGHGAGFWDRGREAGRKLTELAKPYGAGYVYLSTRGKPHLEI